MSQTVEVLLIEDDPEDVDLTREMLKNCGLAIQLSVVPDGIEALAYLRRQAAYADAARPDFVLLDLNMPRKNGRELLEEIRSDAELKVMPVAIFTTSSSEKDMEKCRALGAECFITKPVGLKEFKETAKRIEDFWLAVRQAPPSR